MDLMNVGSRDSDVFVAPFLDGVFSLSCSDAAVDVFNPSNGSRLLSIPAGCEADANQVVASARRSFDDGRWSDAALSLKKRVLHRFADLIEREGSVFDALDAGEMGKPIGETRANAVAAAGLMRFYAEAIDKVTGDAYISDSTSFVAQQQVPQGVVAALVAWNFPTYNAVLKLAPALAAGNSVILKPSELSSRSAIRVAQLALQAGLPTGVLNVLPGLGSTVGRALGLHRDVDMVSFTGSTAVGKLMLQYSGQSNMKRVMTECGGKSPHIVFADGVDLDAASEAIAQALLTNQGQVCSVGSRLLVEKSIEAEMLERITARFGQIVMGNALDQKTTFGPVASATQCARVLHYIETAEADGAQLVAGGRRVLRQTGGFFIEPTVFSRVSSAARIAQEEIFGPVLSVIPFEDESDAIRIANDTIYGLIAYVWTTKVSTGMRIAKGIRSSVLVNAAVPRGEGSGNACSYEPMAQSGIGTEGGLAGMESYLRRKLLWINHA